MKVGAQPAERKRLAKLRANRLDRLGRRRGRVEELRQAEDQVVFLVRLGQLFAHLIERRAVAVLADQVLVHPAEKRDQLIELGSGRTEEWLERRPDSAEIERGRRAHFRELRRI